MDTFAFDLITPEAVFFSGLARQVEAPGTLGEFGVLPGHMNFISTLQPGIVTVHEESGEQRRLFVAGGVAEVNPLSFTILAEEVVDLQRFTAAEASARLVAARSQLEAIFDEEARLDAERELQIAEALERLAA